MREDKELQGWDWEPPCAECWPPIMEENRVIAKVFFFAVAHRRYEQGTFIGLDMNYVIKLMELLQVVDRERCLQAVIKIADENLGSR